MIDMGGNSYGKIIVMRVEKNGPGHLSVELIF